MFKLVWQGNKHLFLKLNTTPLAGIPELTNELIELFLKMRKVSVSFHVGIVQPIIIGFFIKKNTQVLDKFKV
jgi:hypothetical protein